MRQGCEISSLAAWKNPMPSKPLSALSPLMCCGKTPPACSYTLRALCSDPKGSLLLGAFLARLALLASCRHGATATAEAPTTSAAPATAATTTATATATAVSGLGAVAREVAQLTAGVALFIRARLAQGGPLARPLARAGPLVGRLVHVPLRVRAFLTLKRAPLRIVPTRDSTFCHGGSTCSVPCA